MMNCQCKCKQQGAVLIVSMVMLILLTLIGITGVGTSSLEEKMASNARDKDLAFQAAEAALREGENFLNTVIVSPAAAFNGTTNGLYPTGAVATTLFDVSANWDNTNSLAYPDPNLNSVKLNAVTSQPRYIIEYLGEMGDTSDSLNISGYGESSGLGSVTAARISARGTGGTDDAVVYLQSHFSRRF